MVDFAMHHERTQRSQHNYRPVTVALICVLAIAANLLVLLVRHWLWLPLFIDTIFTVAVTFALGLVPGLVVAVLTWLVDSLFWVSLQPFHPFILVAFAEVLLVHLLKPSTPPAGILRRVRAFSASADRDRLALYSIFMRVILIYFVSAIAASVLGGIIDFVYRGQGPDYIGINAIMMALTQSGVHELPAGIFSRFKVNMVDRLIVIFGGYLVAWALMRSKIR